MNYKGAIGFFDSGVGGISIWKEVQALLPHESTVYLADSKNAPYGERTEAEIVQLSVKNTELLLNMGCKLIVVACNTATTNAISCLRQKYDIPFIGIEPAIKPAALQTHTGAVGVLATKGTLSSKLFHQTFHLHRNGVAIIERVGEGLVPLIEKGLANSKEMETLLHTYITPMLEGNVDHLVLGCTHYTYLRPLLEKMMPFSVKIIDSGEAVARQTRAVLEKEKLLTNKNTPGTHAFYTNADVKLLKMFLKDIDTAFVARYLDF
ncbi:glutamate racemase [Ascidiimonas aurantiaca]|uniref:glutamate racemase n=1 Tax=Ascidiimonas aurantiaca TaxID=1685432 RepID=UPI0030EE52FC